MNAKKEWTPFDCPGCRQRLRDGQVTCAACWPKLPQGLRDAWLLAVDVITDERAARAICGHFSLCPEFIKGRRTFPAAGMGGDIVALLECSPYYKYDPRGGGRRWECQGCGEKTVKRDQSICIKCLQRLPRSIRVAWERACCEEDGPEWDALAAWLEQNRAERAAQPLIPAEFIPSAPDRRLSDLLKEQPEVVF